LFREGFQLKTATGSIADIVGIVGAFEKKGMRLTGRKKHKNPERPERQTSLLKQTGLKFDIIVQILTRKRCWRTYACNFADIIYSDYSYGMQFL